MSIIIKIMSDESLPDSCNSKGFTIIEVAAGTAYRFTRVEESNGSSVPILEVLDKDAGEVITYTVTGNAYVMNEQGKTLASFSHAPMHITPTPIKGHLATRTDETPRRKKGRTATLMEAVHQG